MSYSVYHVGVFQEIHQQIYVRIASLRNDITCPAHLNVLNFTILKILGDMYKSQAPCLCNKGKVVSVFFLTDHHTMEVY
jgi:hypothetical protein